jgi:type I restriction enzyme, R subunit
LPSNKRLRRDKCALGTHQITTGEFYIFDYCQNLEFFSQAPETTDGALGESLGKRLFTSRLELISAIDRKLGASAGHADRVQEPAASYDVAMTEEHLRRELAELLRAQVAAMNLNNFIVRPKRRLVEKYAKPETWSALNEEDFGILTRDVAGLRAS